MQGSSHGLQIFIQFSCTIQLPLDMRWIGIGLSQSLGFYEIQKDQRIASLAASDRGAWSLILRSRLNHTTLTGIGSEEAGVVSTSV